jgi:hypothetical protein
MKHFKIGELIRRITMPINQQNHQYWWQLILKMFALATKIPVAILFMFTAGCLAFLGFFLAYRFTAFIFSRCLSHPW